MLSCNGFIWRGVCTQMQNFIEHKWHPGIPQSAWLHRRCKLPVGGNCLAKPTTTPTTASLFGSFLDLINFGHVGEKFHFDCTWICVPDFLTSTHGGVVWNHIAEPSTTLKLQLWKEGSWGVTTPIEAYWSTSLHTLQNWNYSNDD